MSAYPLKSLHGVIKQDFEPNYGLKVEDKFFAQKKLDFQRKYLTENFFESENGSLRTLLSVSYSANLSSLYYARLLNKINTFVDYNFRCDLEPVFLTITLDGFFRDFLKGDYSRWNDDLRKKYFEHIPNDNRFGFILGSIDKKEKLTVKDLYKILTFQFYRFIRSKSLQKLKKRGFSYSFIRVTEPHKKDGVPHFHILFYVPKFFIPSLHENFKKFPAPRNHTPLKSRTAQIIYDNVYESEGFQTLIINPVGYILKYLFKSFVNVSKGEDLDYLQAWYIKHKIPRLITSHWILSQDIYQKSSLIDNDWYYLTTLKDKMALYVNRDKNFFEFTDNQRKIIYDNGLLVLSYDGVVIKHFGKKVFYLPVFRLRALKFSTVRPDNFSMIHRCKIFKPLPPYRYIRDQDFLDGSYVVSDGTKDGFCLFHFLSDLDTSIKNFKLVKKIGDLQLFGMGDLQLSKLYKNFDFDEMIPKSVKYMRDLELFELYQNFDFDEMIPQKFGLVKNEMILRGLLHDKLLPLNSYETSWDFEDERS